ncbi:MAG: TIGR01906 family membrane protein [Firmicutes bacterium]|mgnify:CR=1 FL=1|nr:TIGR01906 family membrane protein [Bacillota bacterium]
MERAACIVAVILMLIVVVLSCIQIIVLSDSFFYRQYERNDVFRKTQIEPAELMRITDEIQAYLMGQRQDFFINGTVGGRYRQIFTEREILHMQDVQNLFRSGFYVRNIALLLLLCCLLYLWCRRRKFFYEALMGSAVTFFGLGLILGVVIVLNFQGFFVLFHEIFFRNDLWLLDPRESILINMVPEPFFMAVAWQILLLAAAIFLICGLVGLGGLKFDRTLSRP